MPTWSPDWPTESGFYWFYGHRFRPRPNDQKELCLVKARRTANERMAYFTNGHFLFEEDARGVFQPALLPELPEEEE